MQRAWRTVIAAARSANPVAGRIESSGNLQNELAKLVSDLTPPWRIDGPRSAISTRLMASPCLRPLSHPQVGLVTPLHDSMNLVAKTMSPHKPCRSRRAWCSRKSAGARTSWTAALLVNPCLHRRLAGSNRDRAPHMPVTDCHASGNDDGLHFAPGKPSALFAVFVDAPAGDPSRQFCRQNLLSAGNPTLSAFARVNADAGTILILHRAAQRPCNGDSDLSIGTISFAFGDEHGRFPNPDDHRRFVFR